MGLPESLSKTGLYAQGRNRAPNWVLENSRLVSIWSGLSSRWVRGQDGNNRVAEMILGLDRISTAVGSAPSGWFPALSADLRIVRFRERARLPDKHARNEK